MNSAGWHIQRAPGRVILSRQLPARFDVQAVTTLRLQPGKGLSLTRVAHQIRQDMWRALQSVRGFSPVVVVARTDAGLDIRAGGRVAPPVAPGLSSQIAEILADPTRRARWMRHAQRRISDTGAGS